MKTLNFGEKCLMSGHFIVDINCRYCIYNHYMGIDDNIIKCNFTEDDMKPPKIPKIVWNHLTCPKDNSKINNSCINCQYHGTFSDGNMECFYPNKPEVPAPENKETINHPSHYGGEGNPYEVIKVIEAWKLGFNLGNTVKYISRAGKKDKTKTIEDLEKAKWYLEREINNLKKPVKK